MSDEDFCIEHGRDFMRFDRGPIPYCAKCEEPNHMTTTDAEPPTHPVQTHAYRAGRGQAPTVVTLRAYEVYCEVYAPQEAMITGGCRGGFSPGELIAFLYARSFPKSEWKIRVQEAFRGMDNL